MLTRLRAALLVATLILSGPVAGSPKPASKRHKSLRTAAPTRADGIYSRRALVRARLILQMRLLEMRGANLAQLRGLLESRLGLQQAGVPAPSTPCIGETRVP